MLERTRTPLPRALERIGGLQTQYAPSGYVGLWSRFQGLEREHLTRALERRTVVQATLMRATIHMVSARDYWPIVEAVRRARRDSWAQAVRRTDATRSVEATAARLRDLLADGPRRRAELVKLLGLDSVGWNTAVLWVDLVRVPPSGTWEQRRADRYGLAEDWLGPSTATEEDGFELLLRRYLGGFGPASRKDVASFTGLPLPVVTSALERLRLRRFRSETGEELLDLPRAFLVDGQVAGTWREERGRIRVEPLERLPRETRRELDDEAESLAEFHR